MTHVLSLLDRQSTSRLAVVSGLLVVLVGLLDFVTGPLFSLILFYLMPIFISSWYLGARAGYLTLLFCAVIFFTTQVYDPAPGMSLPILVWNTLMRVLFYGVVVALVRSLRATLAREQVLAQSDALTGLSNRRHFYEVVSREVRRSYREHRPMTLAYLDLDNFKQVNDSYGHQAGDAVLDLLARTLLRAVRSRDLVARLGGDEFAVLLPDAGPEHACAAFTRVHQELQAALDATGFGAGCSVGVVTFVVAPHSINDAISQVDNLMYLAKAEGKGRVLYQVVDEATPCAVEACVVG